MSDQILSGLKIIDLSHRLPGPLAGHVLAGMGANVLKIEDEVFKDAFLSGLFSQFDESFINWYEELNAEKKLVRLNFSSEEGLKTLRTHLEEADGVIMGLPPKIKAKLNLETLKNPLAIIEMGASKTDKQAMHDLNAMAEAGLLKLHVSDRTENIIDPPLLPISGITFGQQIAAQLLGTILKARTDARPTTSTCYLYESALHTLGPFWPQKERSAGRTKYLHNGCYPCYSIYKLKDNTYVALAAVEGKFWETFCEVFDLQMNDRERFSTDRKYFNQISEIFLSHTREEISTKLDGKEVCLTLV